MKDRMERYCTLHPRSPSAVRRPQVSRRRGMFIVLLGHSLENGIVGIGNTVENALRAFDLQYLRALDRNRMTSKCSGENPETIVSNRKS